MLSGNYVTFIMFKRLLLKKEKYPSFTEGQAL